MGPEAMADKASGAALRRRILYRRLRENPSPAVYEEKGVSALFALLFGIKQQVGGFVREPPGGTLILHGPGSPE